MFFLKITKSMFLVEASFFLTALSINKYIETKKTYPKIKSALFENDFLVGDG